MQVIIRLFFVFLIPLSAHCEIDLGSLVLEGEVRRPQLRKLESNKKMNSHIDKVIINRLQVIENMVLGDLIKAQRTPLEK